MGRIPKSLEDALDDTPERFASYLDRKKLTDKKAFIKEFMETFSKSQRGQNLLKWAKTKTFDSIYKTDYVKAAIKEFGKTKSKNIYARDVAAVRKELQAEFEVSYKQQQLKVFEARNKQVSDYFRAGKPVSGYAKASHSWIEIEKKFIANRLDVRSNKALAFEFNRFFKTSISNDAVKALKLRMRGTKK